MQRELISKITNEKKDQALIIYMYLNLQNLQNKSDENFIMSHVFRTWHAWQKIALMINEC